MFIDGFVHLPFAVVVVVVAAGRVATFLPVIMLFNAAPFAAIGFSCRTETKAMQ